MEKYANMDRSQSTTLKDLMAQNQEHYSSQMSQGFEDDVTDADILNLVPRPSVLRPKNQRRHLPLDSRPALLRNIHNSLEWGISKMTSMSKTKCYETPTTHLFDEGNVQAKKDPPLWNSRISHFAQEIFL
jgi:hypothetical protein